jgi:hypothetical protein
MGPAMAAFLVLIGDRHARYRAMAEAGPHELALRTRTNACLVQEWLAAQAASGSAVFGVRQ